MRKAEFLHHLRRWQCGSISRRHLLGITGLGVASAMLARELGLGVRPARAKGEIGDRVGFCTWPGYYDPANLETFTEMTDAAVEVTLVGSNEEMLAKLQAGATGWDVIVPGNYMIRDYVRQKLLQPLALAQLPAHDPAAHDTRFTAEGTVEGTVYAVPKSWGTTGFVINSEEVTEQPTTWTEFWDLTMTVHSGRVVVHDYQLTTVGAALKYYGHSFNSIDPQELADAEALLQEARPRLFAITSDYRAAMLSGDAVMSIGWTGDAVQLRRENPAMQYRLGREGGEIWADFYAVPADAPNAKGGYALIDHLITPEVNAKEVLFHSYPATDERTNALLPKELLEDPVLYPAAELLVPLEFAAAGLITNQARAELFARFRAT